LLITGLLDHRLDGLFKFGAGQQQHPAAFQAFNPEIDADANNLPQIAAAWVRLSCLNNITH